MEVIKDFNNLIEELSYKNFGPGEGPLTNITFFMGAGFSKAWDIKSPLCNDLFTFIPDDYPDCDAVSSFLQDCGLNILKPINLREFSESYYRLLMMNKYEFLQGRYYDRFNIKKIEKEIRYIVYQEFNKKINLNYLNNGNVSHQKLSEEQKEIIKFFDKVMSHLTGDSLYPEGIRTNFITTNYDFLIEGILDNIFEPDDIHYIHTYRGFTANKINENNNITYLHQEDLVFRLIKLNGGFEIYENGTDFDINHNQQSLEQIRENPPLLILPSKEQDYENLYFNTIFKKSIRCMNESNILVIIGYGFSDEDSIIRLLINNFAESKRDVANKRLFYIDLQDEKTMKDKIKQVFPNKEYVKNFDSYYSGSFLDFCKEFNKINNA